MIAGLFGIWLIVGLVGAAIGYTKQRGFLGFMFSMIFGIFGWLLIAVMSDKRRLNAK